MGPFLLTNKLNKMKIPDPISTPLYRGVKVTSMIRALKSREIIKYISLKRRNTLSLIDNSYKTNGFITKADMWVIWKFYYNFVLNDYRDQ